MRIGCPKEIKNHEYRVGLTPESAHELVQARARGMGGNGRGRSASDASDEQYRAGGRDGSWKGRTPIFAECEMVVKVKEPQAERAQRNCVRGRSSIPTSTSPPIRSRPPTW